MVTVQKGSHGSLAAIALGGIIAIGFTFLTQCLGVTGSSKKLTPAKKRKKVIDPPWAIKKVDYLKLPNVSRKQLDELNRRRPVEEWNTVIFFPKQLPFPNRTEPFPHLKKYFEEAKVSIQISMFVCSLQELSDIIYQKYLEGLIVLVVTDFDTWTAHNNCGFRKLARHGIPVRLAMNGCLMHNKFAIIDEEAVLTGSLNWTRQGVSANNENVAVTTDPRITTKYVQGFNSLWVESRSVDAAGDKF